MILENWQTRRVLEDFNTLLAQKDAEIEQTRKNQELKGLSVNPGFQR